jgi:hypothetical protein
MGNRSLNFIATPVAGGGFLFTDSIKQDVDMGAVRVKYTFGGPSSPNIEARSARNRCNRRAHALGGPPGEPPTSCSISRS